MNLGQQLAEDRALRDAALELLKADLRFLRGDLEERGIGQRITDRLGDSAKDLVDDAVDYVEDNKGVVVAVVAAITLWFARIPILDTLGELFGSQDDEPDETEQEAPPPRSSRQRTKSRGDKA